MSTSTTLLALLEAEPAHGYTLKHRYDERFGYARPLAFGQVYAALSSFERKGLAEVDGVESAGGPQRRRYRITPAGTTVVESWIAQSEPATSYSASTLFAKVSIALISGRPAAEVLATQRVTHLGRMRDLTKERRRAAAAELLAITFELNHLDADLKWIDEAGRRLDEVGREVARA
jgi:DNA-binding PadR family transcriptional regulator